MAFGRLSSIIPSAGPVVDFYTGPSDKLTVGKITIGSKNYNPSRIQIGYKDGSTVRYFEYNRYIKYGEVIETENIYVGAGQQIVVRSTEPDVNFLFYGQTTNDIINPTKSGVLQHTLSTGVTKQSLFTAPYGTECKVTISICNLGPDVATVKLGLADSYLVSSFDTTEYLDYGFQIGPGQTYTRPDIKLGSDQSLIGFSNPGSKVTFLCHGQLYYAVSGLPTSDDFVVLGNTRIDGNLGVGRTATAKLDVVGDAIITGAADIGGRSSIGGDTTVGGGVTISGNVIIEGNNNTINGVDFVDNDIDNARNLRLTGITTVHGPVTIKGNLDPIESDTFRIRSNDIVLGYSTDTNPTPTFTAMATGNSRLITGISDTVDLIAGRHIELVSSVGNLTLDGNATIVSVASSQATLSHEVVGSGSNTTTFRLGSKTTSIAENGGIIIRGDTDKTLLYKTLGDGVTNGVFHLSHGIQLNTGRLHIVDDTTGISIGSTTVITKDKIHGKSYVNIIDDANQYSSAYIPTTNAVTQRSRVVSAEGYFASCSI